MKGSLTVHAVIVILFILALVVASAIFGTDAVFGQDIDTIPDETSVYLAIIGNSVAGIDPDMSCEIVELYGEGAFGWREVCHKNVGGDNWLFCNIIHDAVGVVTEKNCIFVRY